MKCKSVKNVLIQYSSMLHLMKSDNQRLFSNFADILWYIHVFTCFVVLLASLKEQSQVALSTGECLDFFLCCKDPGELFLSNHIHVLIFYTYLMQYFG